MKRKNPGRRAVGYVRVSDESQVDGYSLDAQRNEICRWCLQNGYELIGIYADEGISAYTDRIQKRPQFARLLLDGEAGQFDIAVVHTLDRWARKVSVMSQSLERLGHAGVGFASVTEQIDFTTPAGKMILTVLSAAFELFSAMTGIHVRKSQHEKVSKGVAVGPVPFGYHRPEPGGVAVIDEAEAELVRQAFQRRAIGESYGQIATWLREQGARTRNERMFTAHAVKDILNCRFYIGIVAWEEEEFVGKHEAIVTRDLFERVQARRRQRHQARIVQGVHGLLQGRIACIRCGRPLHSDRNHLGEPMYRERHSINCETNGHALVSHFIDDGMGEVFHALSIPDDWRERMARLATKAAPGTHDAAKLQEQRRRLTRGYADGGYTDAEYEAALAEIESKAQIGRPTSVIRVEEALALFGNLKNLWGEATPDERRRLLAPLVDRVYIDVESRRVAAITPAEGFGGLIAAALEPAGQSACVLLHAEAADWPAVWTWWRRGRTHLPQVHLRSEAKAVPFPLHAGDYVVAWRRAA